MNIIVEPRNDFQEKTFQELSTLVAESNGEFLYKDYPIDGHKNLVFRIFNYSLPGYMSFKKPSAKMCRGSMFLVDTLTNKAQLIALPLDKFFSVGEGDKEDMSFKIEDAKRAFIKQDGSLMTSYINPFTKKVDFKSMNSPTYIDHTVIEKSIPDVLRKEIEELALKDICVDLELTTPENRVIIEYKEYRVYAIKARSIFDGKNIDIRSEEFKNKYPSIAEHLVEEIPVSEVDLERSDIEGYVLELQDGSIKKVKTLPYLSMVGVIKIQDFSKEAVYLYTAAVNKVLDEVRSLFVYKAFSEAYDLQGKLAKADKVEAYANQTYNGFVRRLKSLHEENKHLPRNEYCRLLNKEPGFPILIDLYAEKTVKEADYKKFAIQLFAKKALD